MKNKPVSKAAAVEPAPVFAKTLHQAPPDPKVAEAAKPPKRDNIFSKSRDVREDRGTRVMKTANKNQTFHAR